MKFYTNDYLDQSPEVALQIYLQIYVSRKFTWLI